jgi:hypothetical protein
MYGLNSIKHTFLKLQLYYKGSYSIMRMAQIMIHELSSKMW